MRPLGTNSHINHWSFSSLGPSATAASMQASCSGAGHDDLRAPLKPIDEPCSTGRKVSSVGSLEWQLRVTDGSAGRATGRSAVPQIADDFARRACRQDRSICGPPAGLTSASSVLQDVALAIDKRFQNGSNVRRPVSNHDNGNTSGSGERRSAQRSVAPLRHAQKGFGFGCRRRQLARDHPVAHYAVALDLCGGGHGCTINPHSQNVTSRANGQPELERGPA